MVLFDASARIATPVELGRDFSPVTSVPMKLPSTSLFIVPASLIAIPAPLFPEMTLPADGSVRPTVLFDAPFTIAMPAALARGWPPVTSVPMRLPSTRLFIVPLSLIRIPAPLFPEMTLLASSAIPPTTLWDAPPAICTPLPFPRGAEPSRLVPI